MIFRYKSLLFVLTLFFLSLFTLSHINTSFISSASAQEVQQLAWSENIAAPIPTARYDTAVAELNGKVYVMGGYIPVQDVTTNKVEQFDPVTNTWTTRAPLPIIKIRMAATSANGKIYVAGGSDFSLEIYDPGTNTWTTGTPMPERRWWPAIATGNNGKIYVFGGNNISSVVNTTYEYDPSTDTWTTRANMPMTRQGATAVNYGGKLYVFGGDQGNEFTTLKTVQAYDPQTDTWTSYSDMPNARTTFAGTILNDKFYVIGGGEFAQAVRTVNEYDFLTDSWRSVNSLPTVRYLSWGVTMNNKIYAFAGLVPVNSDFHTTAIGVFEYFPVLGPITSVVDPVQINTTVNASANFTDLDTLDTHTALWDWGDGNISNGTITESNGSGSVTGNHIYTTPGVYTLKLTVTDNNGGFAELVYSNFIVVYDPNSPTAKGTGDIDSPLGAYIPNPTITGSAKFGFLAKYNNGSTPTGNAKFTLKVADFDFKSTSYQWLGVTGYKARITGTGEVKGSNATYGFFITVTDAALVEGGVDDLFRIKIWDQATNTVVYDNQPGEPDDADATQPLTSGSIIIQ